MAGTTSTPGMTRTRDSNATRPPSLSATLFVVLCLPASFALLQTAARGWNHARPSSCLVHPLLFIPRGDEDFFPWFQLPKAHGRPWVSVAGGCAHSWGEGVASTRTPCRL